MRDLRKDTMYSLKWFKEWMEENGESEPDFDSLKPSYCLPPLLEFYNGESVTTIRDWEKRKTEIKTLLCDYILGHFPQEIPGITGIDVLEEKHSKSAVHQFVRLTYDTKNNAAIEIEVMTPTGEGPFPLLMTQSNHRNWGLLALSRGYAVCIYPASDIDDQTYVFKEAYPESSWALIPRRAWLASRVLDYLVTLEVVDRTKIAITGHSRNGKQSLIAAAFDERISAVISSSSGVGGACSFRYMSERYYGESVELMTRSFPEWFSPKIRFFTGKEHYLPIDNHGLLGLIAPRACLLYSAYNDDCESAFALEQSYMEAQKVYGFLDREEALNLKWRPGRHETSVHDLHSYVDWLDQVFARSDVNEVQNSDLVTVFDWEKWKQQLKPDELLCSQQRKDCSTNETRRQCIAWFLGEEPPHGKVGTTTDFKANAYHQRYLDLIGAMEDPSHNFVKKLPICFAEEINGMMYYPKSLDRKTKTLIWLHPYSYARGYTGNYLRGQKIYEYLAERGYIVMAFDQMGFGERILEGKDFYARYPNWSRMGKMVSDVSSAVDFLSSDIHKEKDGVFSWIDPNHIYCAGYSLGGMVALYAGAFDERITGVASFCGFTPMRRKAEGESGAGLRALWEQHSLIPKLGLYAGKEGEIPYDYDDLFSLIAPRPVLIASAVHDQETDMVGISECIERAHHAWEHSEHTLSHVIQQDYNRFQDTQNEILFKWLERQFV